MNFERVFLGKPAFPSATVKICGLRYRDTFHRNSRAFLASREIIYQIYIAHAFPAYDACIKALVCAIRSSHISQLRRHHVRYILYI